MKGPVHQAAHRRSWRGLWIPILAILLWSAIQLARDPTFFWCDDYQAYSSPLFTEIVRAWHEGEWPLLSRDSWCVDNLAGEFQTATFSLPFNALLVAIWALPLTLALKAAALSVTHLVWLTTGVYMLGRKRGLTVPLATAAALATSLSGWVITWGATDWIAFLVGFSWVPWVWWALQTTLTCETVWKRWLRPGIFVALLVTAGNAFAAVEIAMIAAWLGTRSLLTTGSWRAWGPLTVAGLLGAGLSAPAWWLLGDMLASSPRGEWGLVLHTMWSVPWQAWPGLVLPSFVAPWQAFSTAPHASMELACGLFPVAALTAALLFRPRDTLRTFRWELIFLLFCALLVSLPSIGQFRWSYRWLPLFHLLLALTAAGIWQRGLARHAAACGLGLIALFWAGAAFAGTNRSPALAAWLLGLSVVWWLSQRFVGRRTASWLPAAVVAVALTATYLFLPTHQAVPKYSFTDQILDPAPLDPARLYLSLYSDREISAARSRPPGFGNVVRPVNAMAYAGLRFLNGYGSFGGREVKGLFDSHGEVDPAKAESLAGPEGERLLYFLGVDGIVFSSDYLGYAQTLGPEWKKVVETAEGAVYHHDPPRFAPVKVLTTVFDRPEVHLAHPRLNIVAEQRNSVIVQVTAEPPFISQEVGALDATNAIAPIGFVRPYLKGYQAFFNGSPVPVRAYRNILPLVELPSTASGTLELRYRPRGLTGGLLVVALTAFSTGLIALVGSCSRSPDQGANAGPEASAPPEVIRKQ